MTKQTLGITATELFACNPFRILGLPVTATESEIASTYQRLTAMAGTPEADSYKTDFDFPSLPPFKRDAATLTTAYAKLASNGYRCFAYADGIFSQALNIDDVMLNLEDISCYDCFLRCYMWLITNDREFEEPELWVPLCQYIDKMIKSGPDEWAKYFDNRFPESVLKSASAQRVLQSFHTTFSDIILLPIKEMVRGSMKCKTAIDILKIAKIDVYEKFPRIDIPQANKQKPGEPEPKLKIAVKDGEEYFDLNLGKMISFESESDAAVESNDFDAASTSISADAIVGEEEPAPVSKPAPEPRPEPTVTLTQQAEVKEEPKRVSLVEPEKPAEEIPVKHVEAIDSFTRPKIRPTTEAAKSVQPDLGADVSVSRPDITFPSQDNAVNIQINAPSRETKSEKEEVPAVSFSEPVEQTPSASLNITDIDTSVNPFDPFAAAGGSKPTGRPAAVVSDASATKSSGGRRRGVNLTGLDGLGEEGSAQAPDIQLTAPKNAAAAAAVVTEEKPAVKKTERRTLTNIIEDVENKTEETANALLTEQEEEDNLYTDALIKMLRSNRSNKLMKEVDTTHIFDNGDSIGQAPDSGGLTMDAINMKKLDTNLLNSAYDGARRIDESNPKKAIQEKYKNININDMLNPTLGGKLNREYQPDAIDEYKKAKEQDKRLSRTMLKLFGFALFVVAIVAFLLLMTNG